MYLNWQKKEINDFSDKNINSLYNEGFILTRLGKGTANQTRSVRIDLDKFELSSENKRVLKKTAGLELKIEKIPYQNYNWQIGKMGKDFYETKFGAGTFSANKIKELLTDEKKSNFNRILMYLLPPLNPLLLKEGTTDMLTPPYEGVTKGGLSVGYTICLETNELLHYSYPFYSLLPIPYSLNLGMGMMTRAVLWAKKNGKKYIYLGSAKDSKALYKFQFKGMEWFDGQIWSKDLEKIKEILE